MAYSREYAHRPPMPTAEEILEDFNSTREMNNEDCIDPVFASPKTDCNTQESEHKADVKDLSASVKGEKEKQEEVANTYSKVEEFLEENRNLKQSIASMNELSKELHVKKQTLIQLISNINENMQHEQNK